MKEVPVRQIQDEEMIENLKEEEQIEQAILKEHGLKSLALVAIILASVVGLVWLVMSLLPHTNLEDIRKENLRKATIYKDIQYKNWINAQKMVEIYAKRLNDTDRCIKNNSKTGSANDCFIFNNK